MAGVWRTGPDKSPRASHPPGGGVAPGEAGSAGILAGVTAETTPRRAAPARERPRGRGLLVVGVLLLVLGLAAAGWSAWAMFIRPAVDPQVAARTASELRERWAGPDADARPGPGEAVALLNIPKIGVEDLPVVVGTDAGALERGLGWYEGTTPPGELGNFAVAGLRGTNGPLARIGELATGDQLRVETRTATFIFVLTNTPNETTVTDTDTWVVQPVPGKPELRPTEALITITTTRDLFRTGARTVAWGHLMETVEKG